MKYPRKKNMLLHVTASMQSEIAQKKELSIHLSILILKINFSKIKFRNFTLKLMAKKIITKVTFDYTRKMRKLLTNRQVWTVERTINKKCKVTTLPGTI